MTAEEYKAIRRRIGSWKYVAGRLGIDWRTVARRESGEVAVTQEASAAIAALKPSWFESPPGMPAGLKPIPGCAGYAAAADGRLFSCRSKYPSKDFPFKEWGELRPTKGVRGYWVAGVVTDKGRKQLKLHQLILMAFRGLPKPGHQGRHLDDNQDNNHIKNLRWGTAKQNRADLIRNGRMPNRKGMNHPMVKLTDLDVVAIRKMRKQGKTLREIGDLFGVSEASVSLICRKKIWNHV